jgi:hypothetical protein
MSRGISTSTTRPWSSGVSSSEHGPDLLEEIDHCSSPYARCHEEELDRPLCASPSGAGLQLADREVGGEH